MAQFDLLDQLLRQNASPAVPQVDLMAQLAQGLPAQQPGYQVPQVPLVLAPPTPRPVAAPVRKRAVVPSSNLPAGVQTQLPEQTVAEQMGGPPQRPLTKVERIAQIRERLAELEKRDQVDAPTPITPDVAAYDSFFPPKTQISADQFKDLISRTTPGLDLQREDISKFESLFDKMYGQNNRTPSSAEIIGKALMDFGTGSNNIVGLIDKQKELPFEEFKARSLLSKAKNDLSENETKLLNSQFQQLGIADRIAAMTAAAKAKSATDYATSSNQQAAQAAAAKQRSMDYQTKAERDALIKELNALEKPAPVGRSSVKSPKTLTASETADLADLKNQISSVNDLYSTWKEKVGPVASGAIEGTVDYAAKQAAGLIPNTNVSQYKNEMKQKAQIIGKALEGGKLTDVDYTKYIKFLPQPGDTEETAAARIEGLRQALTNKYNQSLETFGQAGYDVKNIPSINRGTRIKQVNKKTGQVRYVNEKGEVVP